MELTDLGQISRSSTSVSENSLNPFEMTLLYNEKNNIYFTIINFK